MLLNRRTVSCLVQLVDSFLPQRLSFPITSTPFTCNGKKLHHFGQHILLETIELFNTSLKLKIESSLPNFYASFPNSTSYKCKKNINFILYYWTIGFLCLLLFFSKMVSFVNKRLVLTSGMFHQVSRWFLNIKKSCTMLP